MENGADCGFWSERGGDQSNECEKWVILRSQADLAISRFLINRSSGGGVVENRNCDPQEAKTCEYSEIFRRRERPYSRLLLYLSGVYPIRVFEESVLGIWAVWGEIAQKIRTTNLGGPGVPPLKSHRALRLKMRERARGQERDRQAVGFRLLAYIRAELDDGTRVDTRDLDGARSDFGVEQHSL